MTKEKWLKIESEESTIYIESICALGNAPENWPSIRAAQEKYIKIMNSVTEVYNMENGKKE